MDTNRLMIIFMFIATISIMTTLSYHPQEAFAAVSGGFSDKGFSEIFPPLEVGNDDQQVPYGDTVLAFDEKQGLLLTSPLHVDYFSTDKTAGDIPSGTTISSTMVIYDPVNHVPSTGEGAVKGCVTFDESVLGIQFLDITLNSILTSVR